MALTVIEQEKRPKLSRGVEWGNDIIVLARVGPKEVWWVRGVSISRRVFCKEYIPARLLLVPDGQREWEGREYKAKELFEGGRLSKGRFRKYADEIDLFFGIRGMAEALDPRKTVVGET